MSIPPTIPAVPAAPELEHPIHWVDSSELLAELCSAWQHMEMIAVDTEFMRSQTYYPKPALIQINDGSGNFLIDPLAVDDLTPLKQLLLNERVTKVLHSCSEDLEVFQTLLGVIPTAIFDTQAAAALCGYGFSLGYANLVQQVLGVELPKAETRSDWLQRPLSQAQTLYAAIDVEYLLVVAEKLRNKLRMLERLKWLEEDAANLGAALRSQQEPEHFYLRIKSAWKLKPVELAILQKLASWRESVAQRRDVPRNRVIKEHLLFALAQQKPEHVGQLRKFEGLTERMIRADGEALIQLIAEARQSDPAGWPKPLPKPLSAASTALMKRIKARVQQLAEELDVAPEMLMRKKEYEALVREALLASRENRPVDVSRVIEGWRRQLLEQPLIETIDQTLRETLVEQSETGADATPAEQSDVKPTP